MPGPGWPGCLPGSTAGFQREGVNLVKLYHVVVAAKMNHAMGMVMDQIIRPLEINRSLPELGLRARRGGS